MRQKDRAPAGGERPAGRSRTRGLGLVQRAHVRDFQIPQPAAWSGSPTARDCSAADHQNTKPQDDRPDQQRPENNRGELDRTRQGRVGSPGKEGIAAHRSARPLAQWGNVVALNRAGRHTSTFRHSCGTGGAAQPKLGLQSCAAPRAQPAFIIAVRVSVITRAAQFKHARVPGPRSPTPQRRHGWRERRAGADRGADRGCNGSVGPKTGRTPRSPDGRSARNAELPRRSAGTVHLPPPPANAYAAVGQVVGHQAAPLCATFSSGRMFTNSSAVSSK